MGPNSYSDIQTNSGDQAVTEQSYVHVWLTGYIPTVNDDNQLTRRRIFDHSCAYNNASNV